MQSSMLARASWEARSPGPRLLEPLKEGAYDEMGLQPHLTGADCVTGSVANLYNKMKFYSNFPRK